MNDIPNLYDLVKLHVAEKYPALVVDFWPEGTSESQIRISTESIKYGGDNVGAASLVSICTKHVYYYVNNKSFWKSISYQLGNPDFLDRVDLAIEWALANKKLPKEEVYR